MSILTLDHVSYSYGGRYQKTDALKEVSCSFEQGRIYAIIGKSGSGKSTMLSLIAGLDVPKDGDVFFREVSTRTLNLDRYRREQVAMIYQNFRLFPLLTALENVMYPMELHKMSPKEAKPLAEAFIRSVDLPDSVFTRYPSMLSGGEQQRVAIARALAMDTNLILADEPTGNLDTENARTIVELLAKLAHEENYCVIIVTHDLEIVDMVDETYQMRDGVLVKKD